jgi:hypothetical protein
MQMEEMEESKKGEAWQEGNLTDSSLDMVKLKTPSDVTWKCL